MLPVSLDTAWQALNDPEILKASIPGCEAITPAGPDQYDVAMTAAIGPVKAKFKGKMRLTDVDAPNAYVIHFEGQGGAAGHGKGSAQVRLEPVSPDQTRLVYTATAQVGGKIAQIGSRLVDMAAQKIANDFFGTFNAILAERHRASAGVEAVAAPSESHGNAAADDAQSPPDSVWKKLLTRARGPSN